MENGGSPQAGTLNENKLFNGTRNIDDISTPSELKFEDDDAEFEDIGSVEKKNEIEKCLENGEVSQQRWQELARSRGGLINDAFRRKIWPLLVGVTESEKTEPPSLDELSQHSEYNQVVLDVNRSLKRFPPGIPYEQRVALQDQLTVLILRVIIKYPHLKYYQGYHDVAITLLLVCGERASFPLLCRLSCGEGAPLAPFMQATMQPTQRRLNYMLPIGYHDVAITLLLVCGERASFPLLCRLSCGEGAPLAPFMQATMQPTQRRLNYMLPIVRRQHAQLAQFLEMSTVGTMFALPWYLTWFGHSLNKYADVVRLYDYFLCSPPLFPVYVTAAIVLHRAADIMRLECDMAMVHCFLSRLPDDLPFEDILVTAEQLYANNKPEDLEVEVILQEQKEEQQRAAEEERLRRRQAEAARRRAAEAAWSARLHVRLRRCLAASPLPRLLAPRALLATAAAAALLGVYAYYRPDFLPFAVNR